jgi:hypothetical protein
MCGARREERLTRRSVLAAHLELVELSVERGKAGAE